MVPAAAAPAACGVAGRALAARCGTGHSATGRRHVGAISEGPSAHTRTCCADFDLWARCPPPACCATSRGPGWHRRPMKAAALPRWPQRHRTP